MGRAVGDLGLAERRHRRQRGDRGAQHRQRHRRAGALAEPHAAGRRSDRGQAAPARAHARVRSTGARPATTVARRAPAARRPERPPSRRCRPAAPGCAAPRPARRSRPCAARSAPPQHRSSATGSPSTRAPGTARRAPRRSCGPSRRRRCRFRSRPPRPARHSSARRREPLPAVVFPMPMSPAISRSAPASTSSSAIWRPASIASRVSSLGKRVLDRDVAAAAPHLVGADLLRQRLSVDREVDDPHRRARDLGQRVDRRAARVDVGHHLGGDLGREGRYPRPGHAVVTGEHHDPRALELRWWTMPLARRHPDRQIFEPAQGAAGLGQGVLAGAGCRRGGAYRAARPVRTSSGPAAA